MHRGEVRRCIVHVKYWALPDINNRIKNEGDHCPTSPGTVARITEDDVTLATPRGERTLPKTSSSRALTLGYQPGLPIS